MSNNNKWQALSMSERAFLIREAVRNGITDINSIRDLYNQTGERIRLGTPYKTFESGSDYDYYNAAPENTPQENDGHWSSRNPHTGQLLKSPNHHTYNLLLEGEKQAGYKIQKIGDREYSFPNEHRFDGEEDQDSNSIKLPFLEGVKIPLFSQVLDSTSRRYLQDITSPKVPYKHSTEEPSHYQRDILHQDIAGISDVTQKVKFGDGELYLYNGETEDKDPNSVFLKAKNLPYFYQVEKRYLDSVPVEHFDVVSQKDLRKYMPKRDYIGSNAKSTTAQNEEVREKVAKLIPGFTDSLSVIANRHNINPSLMYRRISKEGYLDHEARLYNEVIPSIQQKNFFDDAADQEVSGFNEFGLDDIRDVLESKQLKLTKPVQWRPDENVRYNEKGRRVYSVYFPTLWDAMEVKAAELARRKEIMKERGYSGRDLDIWTNASYNLGTEHEDLNNTEWIRKTYSFPDYSHLFKK